MPGNVHCAEDRPRPHYFRSWDDVCWHHKNNDDIFPGIMRPLLGFLGWTETWTVVGSGITQAEMYHHGTLWPIVAKIQYIQTDIAELDKCANDFFTDVDNKRNALRRLPFWNWCRLKSVILCRSIDHCYIANKTVYLLLKYCCSFVYC